MNEYDSNRIYDLTSKIGFIKTDIKKESDCYILNTCHIREKATEKVYHEIGRVKKDFRNLKKPLVIVSGCVAQAESEEMIKREPYIDIVIGPQSYHKIGNLILNHQKKKKKVNETEFDVIKKFDYLNKIENLNNKISSYITIQEGCDKFCHFCVVPYTRGPEYSRPFNQIINEAEYLVSKGTKEIILLGQNVNAYNFLTNNKNYRLSNIINKLNDIKGLKRIRFTTSHPNDMTEDLIDCYKNCKKLMPILHLPVQSGSDTILKNMNRKHNKEYYLSVINKLKKINEGIKFSSDFIVAYPGETEKDLNETIDLIEKVKFINSYSFIYSPRPGTPAAKKDFKPSANNKINLEKVQNILKKIQMNNNQIYMNKNCEVLVENKLKNEEKYFGRTQFMTPVKFTSYKCSPGDLINVKITSFNQNGLFGTHEKSKTIAA